jgi:hypothetical protein
MAGDASKLVRAGQNGSSVEFDQEPITERKYA